MLVTEAGIVRVVILLSANASSPMDVTEFGMFVREVSLFVRKAPALTAVIREVPLKLSELIRL